MYHLFRLFQERNEVHGFALASPLEAEPGPQPALNLLLFVTLSSDQHTHSPGPPESNNLMTPMCESRPPFSPQLQGSWWPIINCKTFLLQECSDTRLCFIAQTWHALFGPTKQLNHKISDFFQRLSCPHQQPQSTPDLSQSNPSVSRFSWPVLCSRSPQHPSQPASLCL